MDKDLKKLIDECIEAFKNDLPIGGEKKYLKQRPGGEMGAVNIDGIMQEIHSIDEEAFRVYNETLCPELWDQNLNLDPAVRIGLLKVAQNFYKHTELTAPIIDVYLMGSIANYNWTPESDADVHVIIDFDKLGISSGDAVKEVVKTASAKWNSEHEVTVKNHKVELNIQDVKEQKPHVTGIYSLKQGGWLRKPVHQNIQVNKMLVQVKFKAMKKYINAVINSGDRDAMKQAKKYVDAFRQYGLDTVGEMSVENIVFKALRAKGLLTQLKDSIIQVYDKEMTVREVNYKDIRQAHPNVDKFDLEAGDYDVSKLTLDNLKALKEKGLRIYRVYVNKRKRDELTNIERDILAYELTYLNKVDKEIKRRLELINAPVAVKNPNKPFEESRDNSWISPNNDSTSYLGVGHHKGNETYLWIWHDGEFKVKHLPNYDGKSTHSTYFGPRWFDWSGRYDPKSGIVSINNNIHTTSGDVPEELKRLLHDQFGTSVKYMRFTEGYGAGIPETDRLKIENQDGSVKRWQIRSKDAPKTPTSNLL